MKKNKVFSLLIALLVLAGCDYNDKYFDGYDDITISELVQYEGAYTGNYPEEGYFSDREALEKAVHTMMKGIYPYCDEGSSAKVEILYGDITPGFSSADESYTLIDDDYIAMGTESGQPGKYKNFDANMDVESYLKDFCTIKYASLSEGKVVSITYKFYASGITSNENMSFKKTVSGWDKVELEVFATDYTYTLEDDDYIAMGTASGEPGRYKNFDSNMDIDHYLTIFLKNKYSYASANVTAEVTYKFFADKVTTTPSRIYKYDGSTWTIFDPYVSTVEITTKIAEMAYDGSEWKLKRLLGGTAKYKLEKADYQMLFGWVEKNEPEYLSSRYNDEEFYFGTSIKYFNINNSASNWKEYTKNKKVYAGKTDEEMQVIMDERIAEGIANILLPAWIKATDSGIAYVVTYNVHAGRGKGDYNMTFMYNEETKKYEMTGGVVRE